MASRWRDWSGLCHVDSYARDAEREIQSAEAVRFTRVEHDHSLKEFYDYYKNKSMSLSPFLELLVKQEDDNESTVVNWKGMGRAEILSRYWDHTHFRLPGGVNSISNETNETLTDTQSSDTLYIKNVPPDITSNGLKGIAESFGVVIHCEMINSDTCILRMKDSSACGWVISYFEGRPFEDDGPLVECGYIKHND